MRLPWCALLVTSLAGAQPTPVAETDVPPGGIANGVAVWVHPTDPLSSLAIAATGNAGLATYDLNGHLVQQAAGVFSNVDLRYGVTVNGANATLVAVANQTFQSLTFYSLDSSSRSLLLAGSFPTTGFIPKGVALYRAPGGELFAFATTSAGPVLEYTLSTDAGSVTGSLSRRLTLQSQSEGAAVDDRTGLFYVAEDNVGIWRFNADPDGGTTGVLIDATDGGHLAAPVKGLALDPLPDGGGYLLASSSGNSTFNAYALPAGTFVRSFALGGDGGLESPGHSVGIALATSALGPAYPSGLFVAQDATNNDLGTNYKYFSWEDIARDAGLSLTASSPDGGTTPDAGRQGNGPPGSTGTGSDGPPAPKPTWCTCGTASFGAFGILLLALSLLRPRSRAT